MIYLAWVLMIFSIIYLVGSFYVTILKTDTTFNKNLLFFGAICYFFMVILTGIAIIDRDRFKSELEKKPEKYELVNEQFYRKIK